jgi:hypothetical protein
MTTRRHRLLHVVMKMDQAGSAGYVVAALVTTPILLLISPLRQLMWLVGLVLGISGLALGLLGFLMAWGLTVSMTRGEEIPEHILSSVRMVPTQLPTAKRPAGVDGDRRGLVATALTKPGPGDGASGDRRGLMGAVSAKA